MKLNKSYFIKSDGDLDYVRYVSYLEQENQQLKERLEQLEMENEYLKKLNALVQQRETRVKKK